MLDLEASHKRDMLNLHTRFLQRLQDNRETRRNICLGLQQVLLHVPYPQYLCLPAHLHKVQFCTLAILFRRGSAIYRYAQCIRLALCFVKDLGPQGSVACDIIYLKVFGFVIKCVMIMHTGD